MIPESRIGMANWESKSSYDSRKSDRNGQMGIKGIV